MTDPAEFLLARIAEDEAYARMAFADHNDAVADWSEISSGIVEVGPNEELLNPGDSGISRHIARHDPARVLADCAAKQRIIQTHAANCVGYHEWPVPAGDRADRAGVDVALWHTLRLLALPYADHPDYREEWRP